MELTIRVSFLDFQFNKYNSIYFMTINVALEEDGYGVSVSHPTPNSIFHLLKDLISLEKLQIDLLLDSQQIMQLDLTLVFSYI